MKKFFGSVYLNLFWGRRFYASLLVCVVAFMAAYFLPALALVPYALFAALVLLTLTDWLLLFKPSNALYASRLCPERLSNGDENEINLLVENFYPFTVSLGIIDEIPHQFQKRDVWFKLALGNRQSKKISYYLRPTKRGVYSFGQIRLYVQSPLGLAIRRYNFNTPQQVPVYPSFLQMRKYELMAISNRLTEYGIKKIRRIGHSMEFEQIKNYVPGDDYRTINWKATARQGGLMVNSYTDEKSQQVYCIIDKSRAMRSPFNGLTLLDYAINASLALSSVALLKDDKAGLITMAERKGTLIAAERRPTQLNKIIEALYAEKTRYLECNMELLYNTIRNTVKQRSLLIFFTNFESLSALRRQLPLLKNMAKFHLLVVVFFENSSLTQLSQQTASNVEDIYIKTIANKFVYEKQLIVKELAKHGIGSILTQPQNLTANTINHYLDLKARQKI